MGDEIDSVDSKTRVKGSSFSPFGLVEAAATLVCTLTLAGFLGGWFWVFELTSHFRVQYAVLLGLASIILFSRRKRRSALLFTSFASINGCMLLAFLPISGRQSPDVDHSFRLLAWNVNSQNAMFDELARLISDQDPDLVLVLEVSPDWGRHINALTNLPNQHVISRDDNFGIALLSRLNSAVSETLHLGSTGVPSIHTTLGLNGRQLSILSTHPLPPAGSRYSRMRDEQFERMRDWINGRTNPVVVAGDLNITPWSPVFTEFMDRTRLINSAAGRGIHGTWPAGFPIMRIPIDHFLHSTNIVVTRREVLKASGSDHLPLLVEFTVR